MAKSKGGGSERFWGSKHMYMAIAVLAVIVAIATVWYSSQGTSGYALLGGGSNMKTITEQEAKQLFSTAKSVTPMGEMKTTYITGSNGIKQKTSSQDYVLVASDGSVQKSSTTCTHGGCGTAVCQITGCNPTFFDCTFCNCIGGLNCEIGCLCTKTVKAENVVEDD